jgi:hypothetical protein
MPFELLLGGRGPLPGGSGTFLLIDLLASLDAVGEGYADVLLGSLLGTWAYTEDREASLCNPLYIFVIRSGSPGDCERYTPDMGRTF